MQLSAIESRVLQAFSLAWNFPSLTADSVSTKPSLLANSLSTWSSLSRISLSLRSSLLAYFFSMMSSFSANSSSCFFSLLWRSLIVARSTALSDCNSLWDSMQVFSLSWNFLSLSAYFFSMRSSFSANSLWDSVTMSVALR
ncbi:hypothetical protein FR483_n841L [Paramecium bursaria Chlorella virus FR483]|uniref:Uncharacterized protein n841L n=1 Tax=Paramecium bursaria Chlorella virus FR483 TaxID=399781 RepID=A7J8J5_PBCVF|nr:hypothetical protein FR483_n841L [Paramecium bursaria Chlorella virus FR483]ABT16126.1 hypothetical protein FR483_n841L [Paramecium bursaria Chlorella virus FR483]